MAISPDKYHTIRTLHSLGYSRNMIAVVLDIPKSSLYDKFSEIVDDTTTSSKKLKISEYKNAALLALSVDTDVARDKISALNALDIVNDETTVTTTTTTTNVKQDILDELSAE